MWPDKVEQAVRDFVLPLVRGDVHNLHPDASVAAVNDYPGRRHHLRLHSHRHRTTLLAGEDGPHLPERQTQASPHPRTHRRRGGGCRRRPDRGDRGGVSLPSPPESSPTAIPPSAVPPTEVSPGKKPRPEFQDASCPDVMALMIPGTWESSPTDDPLNPGQFPLSLMLQCQPAAAGAVRHRPRAGLHRSLHRPVP